MLASLVNRSPLGHAWRCYEAALQKHRLPTQVVSSGCLFAAGDLLAQRLKKQPLDLKRTALTAAFGGIVIGPAGEPGKARHHHCAQDRYCPRQRHRLLYICLQCCVHAGGAWYHGLDSLAGLLAEPGTPAFLALKTLLDGIIWNAFTIATFFLYGELAIDGGSMQSAQEKLSHEFMPTFCLEAALWPPIMYAVFKRLPVAHHLLAVNLVTVLDVTLLAWCREWDHTTSLAPSSKSQDLQESGLQQGLQLAQQVMQQMAMPMPFEHMPPLGLDDGYQSQRLMPALASMHTHSSKAGGMRSKQLAGSGQAAPKPDTNVMADQQEQQSLASNLTELPDGEGQCSTGCSCAHQPKSQAGCEQRGVGGSTGCA